MTFHLLTNEIKEGRFIQQDVSIQLGGLILQILADVLGSSNFTLIQHSRVYRGFKLSSSTPRFCMFIRPTEEEGGGRGQAIKIPPEEDDFIPHEPQYKRTRAISRVKSRHSVQIKGHALC